MCTSSVHEHTLYIYCTLSLSELYSAVHFISFSHLDAPKETKATVSSEDVKEGDSVTLSCSSRGRPDVSFTWFKNRINIENSPQMSELKLINVKPEDSGKYYCEAKNKLGANESNIIIIDVKCKFYANEEKTTRINNLFK